MLFRGVRRLATLIAVNLGTAVAVASPLGLAAGPAQHPVAAPGSATVAAPASSPSFGDAHDFGSMAGTRLAQPVVGMANTPTGKGYWLVARDGGIFSFGDATFFGSTGNIKLNQPIVGISRTPSGKGYWFVAADGGIFSFGDAQFKGSTGNVRLTQPIVGMASTPSGKGYWLVAKDGGIFNFGDAAFKGSAGNVHLAQPIVGMSPTPTGKGYWIASGDGNVYPYGDAKNLGSAAGRSGQPIAGIARSANGGGYWLAATDGGVFPIGTAKSFGSTATPAPVVGISPTPTGEGFWLVTTTGAVLSGVTAPSASTSYGFLRRDRNGKPVRYNPCAPVHYVINPALAPDGAVDEVKTAFQRLGVATGITFAFDGTTIEPHVPFGTRGLNQPTLYGNRAAPVLITWSTEQVEPKLAGGTLGYGGSTSYWVGSSDEAYVSGEVVFDAVDDVLRPGFGVGLTRGNLAMHELGHVAGLDHTTDRAQIMYPSLNDGTPDGYASGDLAGLAQLGASQGCLNVATPAPPPA